jgi:hypothetical protein
MGTDAALTSLSRDQALAALRCSVHIPTWGTLPELTEVVALARAGAICSETECFTTGQAVDA